MKLKATIIFVLVFMFSISTAFFGFDGPDKEAYMKKDTQQYKDFTSKIVGEWKITSLKDKDNKELIGTTFKSGKAIFDFDNCVSRIELDVADEVIAKNIAKWSENKPGLKIIEYKMVNTSPWKITWSNPNEIGTNPKLWLTLQPKEKPDMIVEGETFTKFTVEAKGEGDIAAFMRDELAKYASVKEAKKAAASAGAGMFGGGFGGMFGAMAAGAVADSMTKDNLGNTDYFFVMNPGSGNMPKFDGDNNMTWWSFTFTK